MQIWFCSAHNLLSWFWIILSSEVWQHVVWYMGTCLWKYLVLVTSQKVLIFIVTMITNFESHVNLTLLIFWWIIHAPFSCCQIQFGLINVCEIRVLRWKCGVKYFMHFFNFLSTSLMCAFVCECPSISTDVKPLISEVCMLISSVLWTHIMELFSSLQWNG
jgi:hypothetical protein